ncbi:MAG TPA: hypothetical protein VK934_02950, partial [Fimbriimonas sp.]|nr:hypothetical protein [Fimbriimonas sp.]
AGLTIPGGNPTKEPIRFFVTGTTQSDQLELEVKQTDSTDPAALRVFYSKPGSVFYVRRPTGWTGGQTFSTMIGVYGVTGVTGGNGSRISIIGGNGATDWISVTGGFIADRIEFQGHCKVIHPGDFMAKKKDPISGVGYSSGYTDG